MGLMIIFPPHFMSAAEIMLVNNLINPSTSALLKQINEFHIPMCLAFPEAPAVSYRGHNILRTEETCTQNESAVRFLHLSLLSM